MALILTLAAIITLPGSGSARTWDACSRAAEAAAKAADIPREWMHAIALAESGRGSGRDRTAWPWTVNDQGKGIWFDRKGDAVRHVEQRLAAGREMIDVGCFQINWRWHGQAFPSVEAAFDPQQNARYAAKFLRELFAATGSWEDAIGRYHSATPALAKPYTRRVVQLRTIVPKASDMAAAVAAAAHTATNGAVMLSALQVATPLLRSARQRLFDTAPRIDIPMTPQPRRIR